MAGRKTKTIQFNLADTGRKFSGQSRSNVNLKAWIDLINSPHTQEMVSTGSILGYYGHQIRMLLGTHPPETAFIGGKQISISPAVRTIEIKADDQGNVTHRQEFLETAEGEFAMDKYKAKIGGFSAAHDYVTEGGMIMPVSYAGMDYVLQPNYINNIGDGALMDSIAGNDFVRSTLELSVLDMYDSIHQTNFARYQAEENLMRAIESENKLLEINAKTARRVFTTIAIHRNTAIYIHDLHKIPALLFWYHLLGAFACCFIGVQALKFRLVAVFKHIRFNHNAPCIALTTALTTARRAAVYRAIRVI